LLTSIQSLCAEAAGSYGDCFELPRLILVHPRIGVIGLRGLCQDLYLIFQWPTIGPMRALGQIPTSARFANGIHQKAREVQTTQIHELILGITK